MSLFNDCSASLACDGNRGEGKSEGSGAIRSKPGGYNSILKKNFKVESGLKIISTSTESQEFP